MHQKLEFASSIVMSWRGVRVCSSSAEAQHHHEKTSSRAQRYECEMAAYLVRLCDIREDNINHANQHAVPCRVPSILNNGDHIGPLLGHIDKVPSTPVRELNSIDQPFLQCDKSHSEASKPRNWSATETCDSGNSHRSNNIRDMRHGCSWCSTKVEDPLARSLNYHKHIINYDSNSKDLYSLTEGAI